MRKISTAQWGPTAGVPLPEAASAAPRSASLPLIVGLSALLVAVLAYAVMASGWAPAHLDHPLLDWIAAHRIGWLTPAVAAFTKIGDTVGLGLVLAICTGLLAWRRRTWWPWVVMVVAAAGSVLLTVVLKDVIARPRPPHELAVPPFETSGSFPSGHTLNATALTLVLIYLVLRWPVRHTARIALLVVAVAFPLIIAATRLYLGAHWLTDVIAGMALGLAWACAVIAWDRRMLARARLAAGAGNQAEAEPGAAMNAA